jgi:hypothetical protein
MGVEHTIPQRKRDVNQEEELQELTLMSLNIRGSMEKTSNRRSVNSFTTRIPCGLLK